MTTKQIKRWMNLGGGLLALGSLVVLAWGIVMPLRTPAENRPETEASGLKALGPELTPAQRGPTLDALQTIASLELRRLLRDPPPTAIVTTPLQARFEGTFYEPSNPGASTALFKLADGSQRLLKAGEQFSDPAGTVTVKRVGDQSVVIDLAGEERELKATAS